MTEFLQGVCTQGDRGIVLNDSLYEQIATIAEQDEMLSYNFFMCTGDPIV